MGRAPSPKTPDKELLKAVAEQRFKSKDIKAIAETLKITRDMVYRYMRSPQFKEALRDEFKFHVSQLCHLAVSALEKNLKYGDMEAVKLVFKVEGMLEAENTDTDKAKDSQIVVVMPGAKAPDTVIEVQNGGMYIPEAFGDKAE